MQPVAQKVWAAKYALCSRDGRQIDATPRDNMQRVAIALASVEKEPKVWEAPFYSAMLNGAIPAGRIMSNAGAGDHKPRTSLINCTVASRIHDSMEGIADAWKQGALILKAGCGVGYNFSTLRPKGAEVSGAGAHTSGPLPFMDVFDAMCATIASAGDRRGAQMGVLDIWHPDVLEFIDAKRKDGRLRNFNLSVLISDKFMQAVATDSDWELVFPVKSGCELPVDTCVWRLLPDFQGQGYVENMATREVLCKVYKTLKAREVWDAIMLSNYKHAEPGVLFLDTINQANNNAFCEYIVATNPCVPAWTRLHTSRGLVTVKELYESQETLSVPVDVRCFDDTKRGIEFRPAIPVFKTSDSEEVFRVITKDGYSIDCTKAHKLYVRRGGVIMKLPLEKIQPSFDELLVQSGEGQFGAYGDYKFGKMLGLLAGDGHFSTAEDGTVDACLSFWEKDLSLAHEMAAYINSLIAWSATNSRDYAVKVQFVSERHQYRIESQLLAHHLAAYHVTADTKLKVPEVVWQGTRDCVRGYLQGLFQADGTVNTGTTTCSIRLSSSTPEFLHEVQQLLTNFGIFSKVLLRRTSEYRSMPNGKGGNKDYLCKDNYELIIDGESRDIFMDKIGFLLPYKTEKYTIWANNKVRRKKQSFCSPIVIIMSIGKHATYCTTQKDRNAVIFNGIVSGNCGEQPLPANGACLLGSIDVSRFVYDGQYHMEGLHATVQLFTRMLDNVVEIANMPTKELTDELLKKRRHGMGITGYGSALNKLGLKYGSAPALELLENILKTIMLAGWETGVELAKEKGPCPLLVAPENRESFLKSAYIQANFPTALIQGIRDYGCRFTHHMSIAPTGTTSLAFGNNCSSGIEPTFAHRAARNFTDQADKIKKMEHLYSAEFWAYCEENNLDPAKAEVPPHFQYVSKLTIEDHIRTLATAQKWVDSAISKTINVPTDTSFEDFKHVYMKAWEQGCKGCTTFRPNPEVAQILVNPEELAKQVYAFTLESGEVIEVRGDELVEYKGSKVTGFNLYHALKDKQI